MDRVANVSVIRWQQVHVTQKDQNIIRAPHAQVIEWKVRIPQAMERQVPVVQTAQIQFISRV